uniref:Uncharacterized protein n=1 Tax=Pseudourostyla cristata TaxID=293816 RepID=A0A4P9JMD4_9SPIT|nr:hypothetical protein [Pseudourostyla cristata]
MNSCYRVFLYELEMARYWWNPFLYRMISMTIKRNLRKLNINLSFDFNSFCRTALNWYKKSLGEGLLYIRGLGLVFFIDACITDDEPLWEPIEWSLVQTWIFFIFIFAWIAENLITSRYGSYTGRDKKIWYAWYKTFWLIEFWYLISIGAAIIFVIIPFYYEITYSTALVFLWWNWYTKVFFFKFISIYTIVLLIGYFILINIRWLNWKKLFLLVFLITLFLTYLLYINFIITFFGYFTNPTWYQKTRMIDYIQLSHEPLKWGWGPSKRDHYSYHKSTTTFWFKNEEPMAESLLLIHLFLFLFLFFLYFYWLTLLRKLYVTREISYTLTTYCISGLKQYFIFFLFIYIFIFISYIVAYWRFPIEFLWIINSNTWFAHFLTICFDYVTFFIFIFL